MLINITDKNEGDTIILINIEDKKKWDNSLP